MTQEQADRKQPERQLQKNRNQQPGEIELEVPRDRKGEYEPQIVSVDGLTGFSEAIAVTYPRAEVQRCIIHQIRSSTRYVSYKDIKAFTAALS